MYDYKVDALTTCELKPDELTPPPPPPPLPIQWANLPKAPTALD
jgi:hypothetical protein